MIKTTTIRRSILALVILGMVFAAPMAMAGDFAIFGGYEIETAAAPNPDPNLPIENSPAPPESMLQIIALLLGYHSFYM